MQFFLSKLTDFSIKTHTDKAMKNDLVKILCIKLNFLSHARNVCKPQNTFKTALAVLNQFQ